MGNFILDTIKKVLSSSIPFKIMLYFYSGQDVSELGILSQTSIRKCTYTRKLGYYHHPLVSAIMVDP